MTLDDVMELAGREQYLAVVSTLRADSTIQASLVNAGVLDHPFTGQPVLAFVTYGAAKLRNLRARPQVAVTFRSAWAWATIEGTAELIGPDDPHPQVDAERLRLLLREIFTAAGGQHDDWDAYDSTMLDQGALLSSSPPRASTATELQLLSVRPRRSGPRPQTP